MCARSNERGGRRTGDRSGPSENHHLSTTTCTCPPHLTLTKIPDRHNARLNGGPWTRKKPDNRSLADPDDLQQLLHAPGTGGCTRDADHQPKPRWLWLHQPWPSKALCLVDRELADFWQHAAATTHRHTERAASVLGWAAAATGYASNGSSHQQGRHLRQGCGTRLPADVHDEGGRAYDSGSAASAAQSRGARGRARGSPRRGRRRGRRAARRGRGARAPAAAADAAARTTGAGGCSRGADL